MMYLCLICIYFSTSSLIILNLRLPLRCNYPIKQCDYLTFFNGSSASILIEVETIRVLTNLYLTFCIL